MASSKSQISTNIVLIMVLMMMTIVCLGALSFDYHRIYIKLLADVKRLASTQVVLMVPDEQAKVIADWLATHPEQTKAMLKMVAPGEHNAVTLGPEMPAADGNNIPPLLEKVPEMDKQQLSSQSPAESSVSLRLQNEAALTTEVRQESTQVPVVISENADGVKVISLPNGGIRVTTREEE